jgi:hypothetical protein
VRVSQATSCRRHSASAVRMARKCTQKICSPPCRIWGPTCQTSGNVRFFCPMGITDIPKAGQNDALEPITTLAAVRAVI